VAEPHADVRSLLEVVVERLGHDAVVANGADPDGADVEAAVIEPGEAAGLELARRLHARAVPLVFTSIYPATPEVMALGPVAYLVKPFALYALERAVTDALVPAAATG